MLSYSDNKYYNIEIDVGHNPKSSCLKEKLFMY